MYHDGCEQLLSDRFPKRDGDVAEQEWSAIKCRISVNQAVVGKVIARAPYGLWIDIGVGFPCLIETDCISGFTPEKYLERDWYPVGIDVHAFVASFGYLDNRQILLYQIKPLSSRGWHRVRIGLYLLGLVAAIGLHFWLCYPAATCRGYPRIHWFWEEVAYFLGFLGVALAPAFDDLTVRPILRRRVLLTFTGIACLNLGVVIANLNSFRPHTGHLSGYWGVIRHHWLEIPIHAFWPMVVATPFVFCLESIATTCWSPFRRLVFWIASKVSRGK